MRTFLLILGMSAGFVLLAVDTILPGIFTSLIKRRKRRSGQH
jgi:hypothetical protein